MNSNKGRRQFLRWSMGGIIAGVAGCTGDGDQSTPTSEEESPTDSVSTEMGTPTETERETETEGETETERETQTPTETDGETDLPVSLKWQYTYEELDGAAYDIIQTSDTGFAFLGESEPGEGGGNILVTQTTAGPDPTTRWSESFEIDGLIDQGDYSINSYTIVETNDGFACSHAAFGMLLLTLDDTGEESWRQSYGDVAQSELGSWMYGSEAVVGTGMTDATDEGYVLVADSEIVLHANPDGSVAWTTSVTHKFKGEPTPAPLFDVVQTPDGGYAVAEIAFAIGEDHDDPRMWPGIAKLDASGNQLWIRQYPDSLEDAGLEFDPSSENATIAGSTTIVPTSDGGFVLAGFGEKQQTFFIKTDSDGEVEWVRMREFTPSSLAGLGVYDGLATDDGGSLFVGNFAADQGTVLKFGSDGEPEWNRTVEDTLLWSIERTNDGGLVLGGAVRSGDTLHPKIIKFTP